MAKFDLKGKTVIVTGASGGIGAASTRALVRRGASVVLVDLAQDRVDAVAETLPASQSLPLAGDVTSFEQMTAVVDAAVERFGRVDVVFANAGIANDPPTTLAAADLAAYERVIEVDLLGVVRTIKPALPQIIEHGGHVLITSSIYAFANGVINSAYAASKAGVESLGRSLRVELAAEGASAGVLYPGWVTTPLTEVARGDNATVTELKERAFPRLVGKFITPEQIADAVVAGIEARSPRIIEPRRWAPIAALRGVVNIASDRILERDEQALGLIRKIDAEARAAHAQPRQG